MNMEMLKTYKAFENDNRVFELLNNLLLKTYETKVHYIDLKFTP
jgi:hypothetical protein